MFGGGWRSSPLYFMAGRITFGYTERNHHDLEKFKQQEKNVVFERKNVTLYKSSEVSPVCGLKQFLPNLTKTASTKNNYFTFRGGIEKIFQKIGGVEKSQSEIIGD